jgi:uncharacterized protein (TIGR03435 family)
MARKCIAGCLFTLAVSLGLTQPAAEQPSFEVATVKVNKSGGPISGDLHPGGQLWLRNITLKQLIAAGWRVQEYAVTGGPAWLDSDRFDVVAKAAPATSTAGLQLMLRRLIVESFNLVAHTGETVRPVYALVVEKRGANLQKSVDAGTDGGGCSGGREHGQAVRTCKSTSMALFARSLATMAPHYIDLPVVDMTGLSGRYDFTVTWMPQQLRGTAGPETLATGPTIFEALQTELGLKLELRKLPVPSVVVEKADRIPSEN